MRDREKYSSALLPSPSSLRLFSDCRFSPVFLHSSRSRFRFSSQGGYPALIHMPWLWKADSYPHFTNGFCEMAYQAKSYGRVYHNLYHLVPLYKRAKKDVGKNQLWKGGVEKSIPRTDTTGITSSFER